MNCGLDHLESSRQAETRPRKSYHTFAQKYYISRTYSPLINDSIHDRQYALGWAWRRYADTGLCTRLLIVTVQQNSDTPPAAAKVSRRISACWRWVLAGGGPFEWFIWNIGTYWDWLFPFPSLSSSFEWSTDDASCFRLHTISTWNYLMLDRFTFLSSFWTDYRRGLFAPFCRGKEIYGSVGSQISIFEVAWSCRCCFPCRENLWTSLAHQALWRSCMFLHTSSIL
jgi:hypothetical protein